MSEPEVVQINPANRMFDEAWKVMTPGTTDVFARTYGEHAERLARAVQRELVAILREKQGK